MDSSPPDFVTGLNVEPQFPRMWIIDNYPLVRKDKSMIRSQSIHFTAGQTTSGHKSHWELFLDERREDEKRWIGVFLRLKDHQMTDEMLESAYARVRCVIKNQKGEVIKDAGTRSIRAKGLKEVADGIPHFIDADDANFSPESLVIEVTFKLLTPTRPVISLEAAMEKFQAIFLEKWEKDFDRIRKIPDACKDIKIVASDGKEFTGKKGILAGRCEVLAAMLRSDEAEGNSGVIRLSDISSKALEVFLNFLKTGALLPEWSETGVIVELTNAAGKYQLKELLQFLDVTLGKVCQKENVLALVKLAWQCSLKVAAEELWELGRKGVVTLDDFRALAKFHFSGIDTAPTPTPPVAANKGVKRKVDQR